jgi:hypothetical protein
MFDPPAGSRAAGLLIAIAAVAGHVAGQETIADPYARFAERIERRIASIETELGCRIAVSLADRGYPLRVAHRLVSALRSLALRPLPAPAPNF